MVSSSHSERRRAFLKLSALAAAGGLMAGCGADKGNQVSGRAPDSAAGGKMVRTVRGPLAPSALGITDMHEHVLRDTVPGMAQALMMFDAETLKELTLLSDPGEVPKEFFPEEGNPITLKNRSYLVDHYANGKDQYVLDEPLMVGELSEFAALGGRSILDCSVTFERGSPLIVRRMSERTGINVVLSTGINSHVLLPRKFKAMTASELVSFFEQEIFVGIDDTGVQCGNIKLLAESELFGVRATNDGPLLRGLEAAANVSRNSGVPVTVHAYLLGDQVLDELLTKASTYGMPEGKMILAHFPTALQPMGYEELMKNPSRFAPNLDIGFRAMDRGFILSFDLFGAGASWADTRQGLVPSYDPISLAAIYQYSKAGYADRIVLGTDLWMRNSARKYGGAGVSRLLNFVVPTLKKYGVSQNDIELMLIRNPARLLAF